MSRIANRIARYWYGKGDADFFTPAYLFEPEDQPLLDAGVFTLAKEELHEIRCPFGCGELEPIHILPRLSGKGEGHFVFCSETGEEKELEPLDYQLYAFNPQAMLRYGKSITPEKPKQRHKTFPRETNWIKVEREAVLDFTNDPKRNKDGREPHELCYHVWNLNRVEFEKAASLPARQRGYKNAASLRAYFYKSRHRYVKKKYAKTMSVSIDR